MLASSSSCCSAVRASSRDGQSELHIKFRDGLDHERAFDDLRIRIQQAQARLPVADGKPLQSHVSKMETDIWLPVVMVHLVPASATEAVERHRLHAMARDLRDRLEAVPGMKRVDLDGFDSDRFEIVLDPAALEREGLAIGQVAEALRRAGRAEPAGELQHVGVADQVRLDVGVRVLDRIAHPGLRTQMNDAGDAAPRDRLASDAVAQFAFADEDPDDAFPHVYGHLPMNAVTTFSFIASEMFFNACAEP